MWVQQRSRGTVSSNSSVAHFNGTGSGESSTPSEQQLSRTQSAVAEVSSKVSFFDSKLKAQRWLLLRRFVTIYLVIGTGILSIFSIYWGSMYGRNGRVKNLKMLVVIEDDTTVDGVPPAIGDIVRNVLETPFSRTRGEWLIQNNTEFQIQADKHNNTITEEIEREVHHQMYWASIHVKKNASLNFRDAIVNGDSSYNMSFNTIVSYYESGRDFLAMEEFVVPSLLAIESSVSQLASNVTEEILQGENLSTVFSDPNAIRIATHSLDFFYIDSKPFNDQVLVAPSQVGLIYTIIITFFSFNFFTEIHKSVGLMGIKPKQYLAFRFFSVMITFFFMSLFYSLVTLAFQVDFGKTFGRSGFLVYWMTNYMTMWSVGTMNEAAGMVLIMVYPPMMGFWLLFWVFVNIAPTFAPMALSPRVFRYGYATPIYNSYEITKVIFFDTYKGNMGRNYGILVVNMVISTIILLGVVVIFAKTMTKRMETERAKFVAEVEEKMFRDREKDLDAED